MNLDSGHSSPFSEEPDKFRHAPLLGENVRRLRKRARINKKQFALMVKIGRPFLNKIEEGTANPRLDVMTRMADALGVQVTDLLAESRLGEPPASSERPLEGRMSEKKIYRFH